MKWTKYADAMPPLNKTLVSYAANGPTNSKFAVVEFGYAMSRLDSEYFPRPISEEQVKEIEGYWIELPEVPQDK